MKGIILLILLAALLITLPSLPEFGHSLGEVSQYYLSNTVSETGSMDAVSAVVWSYRGYDTLGEVIVLFIAALAIVTQFRGEL